MRLKFIPIAIFALWTKSVYAQADEFIITAERPGMTYSTEIMPMGRLQFESGITIAPHINQSDSYIQNNNTLRFGLFDRTEVSFGMDILHSEWQTSFSALNIGIRAKILDETRFIPSMAIMTNLISPHVSSCSNTPEHLAPQLYLIFQNDITKWLYLGYNIGAEWDGFMPQPTMFLSVCIGANMSKQISCFIESYNYLTANFTDYLFDIGITWTPIRRLQFDASAVINMSAPLEIFKAGVGISWLIN